MEKPRRAKATKIFRLLPKTTFFSVSHPPSSPRRENPSKPKAFHNKAFSGPIVSIVPVEARRKNGPRFDAQEPTSPKVSCVGQVKRKKVCRPEQSSPLLERTLPAEREKKPTFIIQKLFRLKVRPSRGMDAVGSSEGRPSAAGTVPSLGQMKRFTSGRETLGNFDWRMVERDREECYSEEENDEEHGVAIYHSAPIVVGGGAVALEPRKEVNLWKRRTLAPPVPLLLD